jgi:hypothetical protein
VSEKAAHGSARRFLHQAHREGDLFLSAVRRSVRHATAAVAFSMRGGNAGSMFVHCDEVRAEKGGMGMGIGVEIVIHSDSSDWGKHVCSLRRGARGRLVDRDRLRVWICVRRECMFTYCGEVRVHGRAGGLRVAVGELEAGRGEVWG